MEDYKLKTKEELKEELKNLKAKHKDVYTIETPLNDASEIDNVIWATIYIKKPDRATYGSVNKIAGISAEKAIENFLRTCYVGGDDLEMVIANDEAFYGCEAPIYQIIVKRNGTLKKN